MIFTREEPDVDRRGPRFYFVPVVSCARSHPARIFSADEASPGLRWIRFKSWARIIRRAKASWLRSSGVKSALATDGRMPTTSHSWCAKLSDQLRIQLQATMARPSDSALAAGGT